MHPRSLQRDAAAVEQSVCEGVSMAPGLVAFPAASMARLPRGLGIRLAAAAMLALAAAPAAEAGGPDDQDGGLELVPLTEVPGIVVVPSLPDAVVGGEDLPSGDGGIARPKQRGAAELKLQWRSERYAPGPNGPEVDANASGVEIGVNYKLKSAILIGALAQFDPAGEALYAAQRSLSEHAWMAGPVTTIHLTPALTLEARAAWGVTETGAEDLSPGAAGAQRRLLSARLAYPHAHGAWRFTPSVNVTRLWEEHLHVPAGLPQASETARVDFAPELAYRLEFARSAFIEPKAVLGGFWTFDDLAKADSPGLNLQTDPRLKAEAGVTFGLVGGPKLQALGAVEGGDATTPDVWTGRLQLSVPLQ
jgi:hypothetical protein